MSYAIAVGLVSVSAVVYLIGMGLTYRYCEHWDTKFQDSTGVTDAGVAFWLVWPLWPIYWPCRWGAICAEKIIERRERRNRDPQP